MIFSTDLSEPALIAAVEGNMEETLKAMGQSSVAELYEDGDTACLITNIPFPPFNQVFRTHLSEDRIDARIEEITERFKSRNLPGLWLVKPSAQPDDLGQHLEECGWRREDGGMAGMAVDLSTLQEHMYIPEDLTIDVVDDADKLRHWTSTAFPPPVVDGCFELFSDLGFQLPWRNYLALHDGGPVATSQLFLGAGVAGLYCVRTIPPPRRRGIGAAVTLKPLLDAREMGCRIGVLASSPMGEPMYRRIGFREYCRIDLYSRPA